MGIWQSPSGIWLSNYAAKTVVINDADIQGLRAGIVSPFYPVRQLLEPGRGEGSLSIEKGYCRNYVGVAVATGYSTEIESPLVLKHAVVRGATFAPLDLPGEPDKPAEQFVSMNYRMSGGDTDRRDPISVVDFNGHAATTSACITRSRAPPDVAPCHDTRPDVQGWVCK